MNTSLSIFARALASENLSLSFDPAAPTASFDVDTRHLVMPMWDVSETLQTMLVAHEISHALWTPKKRSMELLAEAEKQGYVLKLLHHIANVIEDVRIEKLMKAKYPGTRRDFFLGYKEIIDTDLFKFSTMDFEKAGLMNRMNLHFKWAVPGFVTLNLSPEEQEVADLIDAVVTFDDAFTLAKALYEHPSMKESVQKAQQEAQQESAGGKNKRNGETKETDTGDGLGFMDGPTKLARKTGDEYVASSITLSPVQDISPLICTTADTLFEYNHRIDNYDSNYGTAYPVNLDDYRKFVRESDAFVRQLVAQFERRKAADEIRRERPKQTGMLNLDRLHQFRTHDDIFLSKIVKQDGKNHGIFFLIDLSGSMSNVMGDCILQVLQLVWFCEKAKIPFEVFGFTSGSLIGPRRLLIEQEWRRRNAAGENVSYGDIEDNKYKILNPKINSVGYHGCRLYGLASSRDSAADRERLLACLYESYVSENTRRSPVISLGGTPTVSSMMVASQFIKNWVTEQNIQIPTVMVVTDGQPDGVHMEQRGENVQEVPYSVLPQNTLTVHNEILQTMTRVDTKKYRKINMGSMVVGVMLDDLKATLNARTVGMYVGPKTFSDGIFANFCLTQDEVEAEIAESNRQKAARNWNYRATYENTPRYEKAKESYNDGCLVLPASTNPGYDAFFLIKTPKIVKDSEAIAESGTFTKIKNTFIKTMGRRAGSRVFLTKYVDIVAGQPVGKEGDSLYALPATATFNRN